MDNQVSNSASITGIGSPFLFVNGYDQALKYYLMPVWNGFGVRFIMEVASAAPVIGAPFTVIDSMMYGIIGDTDAARAKMYEVPIALAGLGLEYKAVKLASTAFKIEEKAIATEAKTFNFDLQLFAKGSGRAPNYIKDNRVPLDKETVLSGKEYQKTSIKVKGAQVYKSGDYYYYRDTFHTGEASHLEVFDKRGNHIGEANPQTGELIPGTADPTKKINVK